jgi:hypothetical protein
MRVGQHHFVSIIPFFGQNAFRSKWARFRSMWGTIPLKWGDRVAAPLDS